MDYVKLSSFLDNESIPVSINKTGFLEIIRKQNNENINSSLYAHFLSCGIDVIEDVFLTSLLQLIKEKSQKEFELSNIYVQTEVRTPKGNKIDIVIEDFTSQKAILIENKIYHYLNNDLQDYWNYYKTDELNKIGVLLTLDKHYIPYEVEGKFINITHIEWINKIKSKINFDELPPNYNVYLYDFINSIESISKTYKMNESAKFYFQHASQIIKAKETADHAHIFLNNQLQLIADKIGLQSYGNSVYWRNYWDENNRIDTYLTLITKDIVEGNMHFMLILELNRKDKERENELINKFKNHPQYLGKLRGESKNSHVHFLCKVYNFSIDDLENFSDIVVTKIQEDFATITIEMIKYLYPNHDISSWENQLLGVMKGSQL